MKKSLVILATVGLVAVGCERRDTTMDESAGAEQQIEQQKEAQVEQLEAQKEQIEQQAEAKTEAVEAKAEAEQAQLDAQQEQVQAEAKAEQAQLEAQQEAQDAQQQAQQSQQEAESVQQEAAGATAAGAASSDQELEQKVRQELLGDQQQQPQPTGTAQNITVQVSGGKVTLTGTVQSDQQKQDMEQKAKAIQGVQEVDNQLQVQDQ